MISFKIFSYMLRKFYRGFYKIRSKPSFSQYGEDLIIKHILKSVGIKNPIYVDIGAYDPVKINNTFLFYLYGSRGINIEPNPEQFKLFLKTRKRDININVGIAQNEDMLDYFYFEDSSLNTFSINEKDKYQLNYELLNSKKYQLIKTEKIIVKSLESVLFENGITVLDFLTIDTEGLDFQILTSLDFVNIRPKVICFESVDHSSKGFGQKRDELINFLISKGYSEYAFTGLNSIMIDSEFFNNV